LGRQSKIERYWIEHDEKPLLKGLTLFHFELSKSVSCDDLTF